MWPVQTLTLLLCLTDDEQLFAQSIPTVDEGTRNEQVDVTVEEDQLDEKTLVIELV